MKPKIFIAMHYMEIGGAESSLIGLLEALNPDIVDVDLFIYSHQGLFMSAIPSYVNLLPETKTYAAFEKPLTAVLKTGEIQMFLARLWAKLKHKKYRKASTIEDDDSSIFGFIGKYVSRIVPDINPSVQYDLAISYLTPHNFVLDHVRAKKKIAWIHTDYSRVAINTKLELSIWSGYDRIVSISRDVTKGFLCKFPTLADRILEMENILPVSYIKQRASKSDDEVLDLMKKGVVNLCSIGRISNAKNYDNIPYMAAELKKLSLMSPLSFRWFIVGPGDYSAIEALSKELGVDDVVTFLGPSSNPYTYIKACDIYVHPSRYEGKSIVVREAQILCKPVIITNYPTSKSQINDGVDGVICELDNKKIAEAIFDLAKNRVKQQSLIDYLRSHDFAGLSEVNKIYALINE